MMKYAGRGKMPAGARKELEKERPLPHQEKKRGLAPAGARRPAPTRHHRIREGFGWPLCESSPGTR